MKKYKIIYQDSVSNDQIDYALDRIETAYNLIEDAFGRKGLDESEKVSKVLEELSSLYQETILKKKVDYSQKIDDLINVINKICKEDDFVIDVDKLNDYSFTFNSGISSSEYDDKKDLTEIIYAKFTLDPDTGLVKVEYDEPAQNLNWGGDWEGLIRNSGWIFNLPRKFTEQEKELLKI